MTPDQFIREFADRGPDHMSVVLGKCLGRMTPDQLKRVHKELTEESPNLLAPSAPAFPGKNQIQNQDQNHSLDPDGMDPDPTPRLSFRYHDRSPIRFVILRTDGGEGVVEFSGREASAVNREMKVRVHQSVRILGIPEEDIRQTILREFWNKKMRPDRENPYPPHMMETTKCLEPGCREWAVVVLEFDSYDSMGRVVTRTERYCQEHRNWRHRVSS